LLVDELGDVLLEEVAAGNFIAFHILVIITLLKPFIPRKSLTAHPLSPDPFVSTLYYIISGPFSHKEVTGVTN
jgi:hypothetical protein